MNSTTTSWSTDSAISRLRSPSSVVITTASERSRASRRVTKSNRSKIELSLWTSAMFSISGGILVQPAHDLLGDDAVGAIGAVDQLDARHPSHPGELTPGICRMRTLHGLNVAGQQLVEAKRRACGARGSRLG